MTEVEELKEAAKVDQLIIADLKEENEELLRIGAKMFAELKKRGYE